MNSNISLNKMSRQSLEQFVEENEELLRRLYGAVKELNKQITFETFCIFTYEHSY